MDVKKHLKRQILFSACFVAVGIAAGIAAVFCVRCRPVFIGIFCGFFPVGTAQFLLYARSWRKPAARKNIETEQDERNIFLNAHAGRGAFWLSYWVLFAAVMLGNLIAIPFLAFGIFMLFFMPVAYFALLAFFNKKY